MNAPGPGFNATRLNCLARGSRPFGELVRKGWRSEVRAKHLGLDVSVGSPVRIDCESPWGGSFRGRALVAGLSMCGVGRALYGTGLGEDKCQGGTTEFEWWLVLGGPVSMHGCLIQAAREGLTYSQDGVAKPVKVVSEMSRSHVLRGSGNPAPW